MSTALSPADAATVAPSREIGSHGIPSKKTPHDGRDRSTAVLYVACGGGAGRPAGSRDRSLVRERLAQLDLPVTMAADIPEAFERLAERRYALCVLDLAAGRSTLAIIRVIRAQHPHMLVVGIADPNNPVAAGEAIHAGFVELLPSSFQATDLLALLANAQDRQGIEAERFETFRMPNGVVAHSPAMQVVMEQIRRASAGRGSVLLTGEPGTGRQFMGRTIHMASETSGARPFVSVDCSGVEADRLEGVIFGTTVGRRADGSGPEMLGRESAIVAANGGTLFIEHLLEAPARVQTRLARLLRDQEAVLAGRGETIKLDVRPMASVTSGADAAVADGRLHADLVERLSQTRIDVPALRRRREDIPLLAASLLRNQCADLVLAPKTFSRSALALLAALPWPGNAAELQSLVGVLCCSRRHVVQLDDVLEHASLEAMAGRLDTGITLRDARAQFERDCITSVLMRHHGRVGEAAKELGIQRTNLYRKVRQLNVARSLLSVAR